MGRSPGWREIQLVIVIIDGDYDYDEYGKLWWPWWLKWKLKKKITSPQVKAHSGSPEMTQVEISFTNHSASSSPPTFAELPYYLQIKPPCRHAYISVSSHSDVGALHTCHNKNSLFKTELCQMKNLKRDTNISTGSLTIVILKRQFIKNDHLEEMQLKLILFGCDRWW